MYVQGFIRDFFCGGGSAILCGSRPGGMPPRKIKLDHYAVSYSLCNIFLISGGRKSRRIPEFSLMSISMHTISMRGLLVFLICQFFSSGDAVLWPYSRESCQYPTRRKVSTNTA